MFNNSYRSMQLQLDDIHAKWDVIQQPIMSVQQVKQHETAENAWLLLNKALALTSAATVFTPLVAARHSPSLSDFPSADPESLHKQVNAHLKRYQKVHLQDATLTPHSWHGGYLVIDRQSEISQSGVVSLEFTIEERKVRFELPYSACRLSSDTRTAQRKRLHKLEFCWVN